MTDLEQKRINSLIQHEYKQLTQLKIEEIRVDIGYEKGEGRQAQYILKSKSRNMTILQTQEEDLITQFSLQIEKSPIELAFYLIGILEGKFGTKPLIQNQRDVEKMSPPSEEKKEIPKLIEIDNS
mmetsp:Transcript_1163/g.1052  ORF Transcript_1163/g.1052 Transcript_1163/m.1052 type:complete len:125 (+) Transcript_1163:325-699(+)